MEASNESSMVVSDIFLRSERVSSCQSLLCLIQGLCDRTITVELRNEITIVGTVSHVDSKMNVYLTGANVYTLKGISDSFQQLFVQGKLIRYIHIPDEVDVMKVIEKMCTSLSVSNSHTKRRMRRSRLNKHIENKANARAYKLGKGRTL